MKHKATILAISEDTFETRVLATDKPEGFDFQPGQAVNVAIDRPDWKEEERPFTMTSLPDDPCLQFTIKTYPERDGVTDKMRELRAGDELLLGEPWGAIEYQGPGIFIAGGAGITPFLAILRDLRRQGQLDGNTLLYANSSAKEAIAAAELKTMLGEDCHFFVTDESHPGFTEGRIGKEILKKHLEQASEAKIYLCGPPAMTEETTDTLKSLGVSEGQMITEDSND
jgi:ferredoxin-NADP reductase